MAIVAPLPAQKLEATQDAALSRRCDSLEPCPMSTSKFDGDEACKLPNAYRYPAVCLTAN
jgi:hypothetical protein